MHYFFVGVEEGAGHVQAQSSFVLIRTVLLLTLAYHFQLTALIAVVLLALANHLQLSALIVLFA